ncbi:ABC transporter substrate-binding protein [Treponema brennaborense]|uniref:ABC transporter substrate binding protein n=1 Tax=Treponema brennaborense (strain DSM 12168 / CIP 105900 / DD5/3) TaxID=906968 RepID=F4LN20_TREBD|nr:ABC transporter substrate-binding protein [Treponema brennaborense]AEE15806.1 ABC transporter substrate binding protein [Treponema brennaborense DSM 12168]
MKKTLTLLFTAALASAALFAGGTKDTAAANDGTVKIGIAKIVQHVALDQVEQGIIDAVNDAGFSVTYDLQNANGDVNTAAQIAAKFKAEKVDVAVGIATPVAVALATAIKDRPVVFGTITDPVGAGLVSTLAHGEGNVTGMSDAIPTREHIKMFKDIAGIKTLGYIYTSNEANSVSALALVESACDEFGIKLVTQSISTSAEVKQAAEALVSRVDGVYLTTDNTVFSALNSLIQVFDKARKPIFSGDVTGAMNGGCLIASGFNYYKAGYATGEMVVQILNGAKPADIPVRFMTEPSDSDLLINLDAAALCGITVPQTYVDSANMIYRNGTLTQK